MEAGSRESFCSCGTELVRNEGPVVGLVLYDRSKKPIGKFPLTKDATSLGRLDAVAGVFPDIDLGHWLEPDDARKISRQHALILRSRDDQGFSLRPLAGNTGTQLEADMILPDQDYPLPLGARILLGGVARMKIEAIQQGKSF